MQMYVCMYICMYVCMYVYVCIYMHICVCSSHFLGIAFKEVRRPQEIGWRPYSIVSRCKFAKAPVRGPRDRHDPFVENPDGNSQVL